jgi:hypothetical protein
MNEISANKIQRLIEEAEQAGVPDEELQELRDYLAELKSVGKIMRKVDTEPMSQESRKNGKMFICVSTAPISSNNDDDFEGLTLKPVQRS